MTDGQSQTPAASTAPRDPPEPPPPIVTASRVRTLLQLCGGGIAVVQGAVLPFLGIFFEGVPPTSVPVFLGAVGLAGVVAPAITFDARRREKDR